METVKALLENTKHDLEMKLWWAEEHDKEAEFIEEIPKIKKKIADINEALLRFFSAEGRSEQLVCAVPDCKNEPIKDAKHGLCGKHIWPNAN